MAIKRQPLHHVAAMHALLPNLILLLSILNISLVILYRLNSFEIYRYNKYKKTN